MYERATKAGRFLGKLGLVIHRLGDVDCLVEKTEAHILVRLLLLCAIVSLSIITVLIKACNIPSSFFSSSLGASAAAPPAAAPPAAAATAAPPDGTEASLEEPSAISYKKKISVSNHPLCASLS